MSQNDAASWGLLVAVRSVDTGKADTEAFVTLRLCSFPRAFLKVVSHSRSIAVWNFLQQPSYHEMADCVFSVAFSRTLQQYPQSRVQQAEARSLLKR
jgi:hypothetical protein